MSEKIAIFLLAGPDLPCRMVHTFIWALDVALLRGQRAERAAAAGEGAEQGRLVGRRPAGGGGLPGGIRDGHGGGAPQAR